GPRAKERWGSEGFQSLQNCTTSRNQPDTRMAKAPELRDAVEAIIARVIEVEVARGETPTDATKAAASLKNLYGLDTLFTLLAALGKNGFTQTSYYGNSENKPAVMTTLIQQFIPRPEDTPEAFAKAASTAIAAGRCTIERIAELGLVNPRWV